MNSCHKMLTTFNDNPDLLKKVITGNESWVYDYDIETKAQSSQWKRPKDPRLKKHVKFVVVHHEFLPQGRTFNKEYYIEVMCQLREAFVLNKLTHTTYVVWETRS